MRQILLNVNFCDDISTYKLEKNNRKIEITTGYSFSKIRLVPQELEGVCVVYTSGNARVLRLSEVKEASAVDGGCSFAVVQPDISFSANAVDDKVIHNIVRFLDGHGGSKFGAKPGENTGEAEERRYTEVLAEELGVMLENYSKMWSEECIEKKPARIKNLAGMITERHGIISLPELADSAGCTVRHVHRIFKEETGKGPKEFARIVRVRYTVQRILEDPYEKITNYMEEMGYSDQAHFQREFKWYTGYTPGNFIKILREKKGECR